AVPLHRFGRILRSRLPGFVEVTHHELGLNVAAVGGARKPFDRLRSIGRDAAALVEGPAERAVDRGLTSVRRGEVPLRRLGIVLGHAIALRVQIAERGHGATVTLLRGLAIPGGAFTWVLFRAL